MPVQHKILTTKETIEHKAVANTKYLHQIASTRESALSALCGSRCDFVRSCFAHSHLVSSVINSTDHPILRVPSCPLWLMALEAFDLSVFIRVNLRQRFWPFSLPLGRRAFSRLIEAFAAKTKHAVRACAIVFPCNRRAEFDQLRRREALAEAGPQFVGHLRRRGGDSVSQFQHQLLVGVK
jgi:hypothetical protein